MNQRDIRDVVSKSIDTLFTRALENPSDTQAHELLMKALHVQGKLFGLDVKPS